MPSSRLTRALSVVLACALGVGAPGALFGQDGLYGGVGRLLGLERPLTEADWYLRFANACPPDPFGSVPAGRVVDALRARRAELDTVRLRAALGRVLAREFVEPASWVYVDWDSEPDDPPWPRGFHGNLGGTVADPVAAPDDPFARPALLDEALCLLTGVVAARPDWSHVQLELGELLVSAAPLALLSDASASLAVLTPGRELDVEAVRARLDDLAVDDTDAARAQEWLDAHLLEVVAVLAERRADPDAQRQRVVHQWLERAWRRRAALAFGAALQHRAAVDLELYAEPLRGIVRRDLPSWRAARALVALADGEHDDDAITRWAPFARQHLERLDLLAHELYPGWEDIH